jgi:hypothetical protein
MVWFGVIIRIKSGAPTGDSKKQTQGEQCPYKEDVDNAAKGNRASRPTMHKVRYGEERDAGGQDSHKRRNLVVSIHARLRRLFE